MRLLSRLLAAVLALTLSLQPALAAGSSRTPGKGSTPTPTPIRRNDAPLVPLVPRVTLIPLVPSAPLIPLVPGAPDKVEIPGRAKLPALPPAAASSPVAAAKPVTSKPGTDVTLDPRAAKDPLTRRVLEQAESGGFVLKPQATEVTPDGDGTARPAEATLARTADKPAPAQKPVSYQSTARAFFGALLSGQAGVEIMGLAVPQYAEKLAENFQHSSYLYAAGFVALAIGGLLAGPAADRYGTRKVYLVTLAARVAVGLAMGALFPQMTLPLLVVLFSADFFALGGSRVAEGKISTDIHDAAQGKVREWGTLQEFVTGIMGMAGLFLGARILSLAGVQAAFYSYAAFVGISGLILYKYLRLPPVDEAAAKTVKSVRARLSEAWRFLKSSTVARLAAIGYAIDAVLTAFVYFVIGPKLSLFAAQSGAMTSGDVNFWTSLVFAAGAFLGAVALWWTGKRQESQIAAIPEGEGKHAAERKLYFRSATRWLLAAAVSFLALWVFPWAQALHPGWSLAVLGPFGFTLAGVFVSLEAIIKTETPAAERGSVFGLVRAIGLVSAAASFLLLGAVFQYFTVPAAGLPQLTAGGFVVLAAVITAAAAAYAALARALRRQTPPSASTHSQ